ncbi:MAG: SpoIID/LytB domain-containing protein [Acidobacteriota bacterium]
MTGLLLLLPGCRKKTAVQRPQPAPEKVLRPKTEPRIRVLLDEGFGEGEVFGAERAERILFRVSGGTLHLIGLEQGAERTAEAATGFRLRPRGEFLQFKGRRYRGYLDVFVNPYGVPVVVNDLPLEDYLRGVLPRELGPDRYPYPEALKAQAVAARTFALHERGRFADRGFDIYATEQSQVYAGADAETEMSDRAVASTRGVVAVFQGAPIVAVYCSTCGGQTEAFDAVFSGGRFPYLRGGVACPDDHSPYHRWRESRSGEELERWCRQKGLRVGRLRDLVVTERSPAGRALTVVLEGSEGAAEVRGTDLRFGLNLRSTWWESVEIARDAAGYVEGITIEGRGWGHGVGLCQLGAVELARRGRSWEQILAYYYPGVTCTRWY